MARVGDILAGKYRLVDKLGHGGMGTVFEAEHIAISKRVAVKVLHRSLTQSPVAVARLTGEARAAAATGHPGVVEVFDLETNESGETFLVMELLRGRSLSAIVREKGHLELDLAVEICCEVLTALEAVHEKGILHRDIKPSNIVVDESGPTGRQVKLLDFGVAKMRDAAGMALTRPGSTVGTPAYMAPEQARGERDLDERADIWAVGVLLYVTLTGQKPFAASQLGSMTESKPHGEMIKPRDLREEIPEGLEKVLLKAMTARRDQRYRSAAAMLDALESFAAEGAAERWTRPPSDADGGQWEAPKTSDITAPDLLASRPSSLPTIRTAAPIFEKGSLKSAEESPTSAEGLEGRPSDSPTIESAVPPEHVAAGDGMGSRLSDAPTTESGSPAVPHQEPKSAPASERAARRGPAPTEPTKLDAGTARKGASTADGPATAKPRLSESPTLDLGGKGRDEDAANLAEVEGLSSDDLPSRGEKIDGPEEAEGADERRADPPADFVDPNDEPVVLSHSGPPWRLTLGATLVVLAALAGAVLLGRGLITDSPGRGPRAGEQAAAIESSPEASSIELVVVADQPSAQVRVDDGELQQTPFEGHFPLDGESHGIVVIAEGFLPSARFVSFSRDQELRFTLQADLRGAASDGGPSGSDGGSDATTRDGDTPETAP